MSSCNTCKYNDRIKEHRQLNSLFYCLKHNEHMLDNTPCNYHICENTAIKETVENEQLCSRYNVSMVNGSFRVEK